MTLNASEHPGNLPGGTGALYSVQLLEKARADTDTVLKELGSQLDGLSAVEAGSRLKRFGTNEIAREKHQSALMRLLNNLKNPLVLLLMALGVLSFLTGDLRATVVIFVMVVLGVVLRFFQELRADNAAEKLQAMVSNTATSVHHRLDIGPISSIFDYLTLFPMLYVFNCWHPNTWPLVWSAWMRF